MRSVRHSRGLFAKAAAGALAGAMVLGSLGAAQAASFLEKNFWLSGPNYSGNVPACDTPAALSHIQKTFAQTESRFWNSSATLEGFERIHEIAFRPWGDEYIPRRYCSAEVIVTGVPASAHGQYVGGKVAAQPVAGKRTKVFYSIVEDGGFVGYSWGVEWCVEGFDRSWTYAPNCRMARP